MPFAKRLFVRSAFAIALIAGATLLLSSATPDAAEAAERYAIRSFKGSVEVGRGAPLRWHAASESESLRAGDRIRTGARSKAEVAWDGQTVRLYANSMLKLPQDAKPAKVERGHSLIDVMDRRDRATPFKVETADIVVVVRGTRFAVDLEQGDGTRVAVFEGEVALHEQDDAEAFPMSVRPGYVARMGGGAAPMLVPHGLTDPWSSWGGAAPAAPSYDEVRVEAQEEIRATLREIARDPVFAGPNPEIDSDRSVTQEMPPAAIDPVQDIGDTTSILRGTVPPPPPPPVDND